jgi:hypothetical protein
MVDRQISVQYSMVQETYKHGGVVLAAEGIPQQPRENRVPVWEALEGLASPLEC